MAPRREAPPAFVARMRSLFPDFVSCDYNELLGRWSFTFLSAANRPATQFWGWFTNPMTGAAIDADPVTGLLPYRGLDAAAQEEIIRNCQRSFIANPVDGHRDWKARSKATLAFNRGVATKARSERADNFATIIREVDLRRPWIKEHSLDGRRPETNLSSVVQRKTAKDLTPPPGMTASPAGLLVPR